jgi:hypothetical protein
MERPNLSLENEIVNFFSHLVKGDNAEQNLKHIPSLVKSALKECATVNWTKGEIFILERESKNIQDSVKEIENMKKFNSEKEEELKKYYFREEIKGT